MSRIALSLLHLLLYAVSYEMPTHVAADLLQYPILPILLRMTFSIMCSDLMSCPRWAPLGVSTWVDVSEPLLSDPWDLVITDDP
jgi:hypothetical protein